MWFTTASLVEWSACVHGNREVAGLIPGIFTILKVNGGGMGFNQPDNFFSIEN